MIQNKITKAVSIMCGAFLVFSAASCFEKNISQINREKINPANENCYYTVVISQKYSEVQRSRLRIRILIELEEKFKSGKIAKQSVSINEKVYVSAQCGNMIKELISLKEDDYFVDAITDADFDTAIEQAGSRIRRK